MSDQELATIQLILYLNANYRTHEMRVLVNVLRGIRLVVYSSSADRAVHLRWSRCRAFGSFRSLELGIIITRRWSNLSCPEECMDGAQVCFSVHCRFPGGGLTCPMEPIFPSIFLLICHRLRRTKAMRARIMCIRPHFILPAITCMSDLAKFSRISKGLGYLRVGLVSHTILSPETSHRATVWRHA